MPRPIATADRQWIHRLAHQGLPVPRIAQRLKVSPRSVRRLLGRPVEQLAPCYERCGRPVDPSRPCWQEAAAALRREHPRWGAQRLLLDLAKQPLPGTPPPLRTLERWLARTDLPPAPPGRRPAERPPRAQEPHERWQMDAMDQVRLGDGRQASCLRIVDECSGALWATAFSPQGNWAQVPAAQTQAMLRQWLACWGRPLQIRVDNGTPWGSSDDVPTPLALWLVGLGVARHWNDPSCPQQNGVVERSMGTFKGWSEPRTCQSVEQ